MTVTADAPRASPFGVSKSVKSSGTDSTSILVPPPWKHALVSAIANNAATMANDPEIHVQLATVSSTGRPSCRTLVFRGFFPESIATQLSTPSLATSKATTIKSLSESSLRCPKSTPTKTAMAASTGDLAAPIVPQRRSSASSLLGGSMSWAGKLSALLEFVTDVRSQCAHCTEDIAGETNFGEVCWYFPGTKEQFRLSGRLYQIAQENVAVLATSTPPPWAPKKIDWERERLRHWNAISPELRASFSWGVPGTPWDDQHLVAAEDAQEITSLPSLQSDTNITANHTQQQTKPETKPQTGSTMQGGLATAVHSESDMQDLQEIHDRALSYFGLLLMDVDHVDHLDMSVVPPLRTEYKVVVPERTYGRILGLEWDVRRVVP
ncbi:hypothetical protein HK102_003191 [Quaeritorhiza haematococci]|nr:hypothetical protein HK102_003191 [Quaeritorhiza haematococci]